MSRMIDVTVTVKIRIDESVWANEYGIATSEVAEDVGSHLSAHVDDLVKRAPLAYLWEDVTTSNGRVRVNL